MADDKGRKNFSDFDPSEIFTDFRTHSGEDKKENDTKPKFVVRIDDSVDDSFEYDFAAFSDASERAEEEKRREESRRKIQQLSDGIDVTSARRPSSESRRSAPQQRVRGTESRQVRHTGAPVGKSESIFSPDSERTQRPEARRRPVATPRRRAEDENASTPVNRRENQPSDTTRVQNSSENNTPSGNEQEKPVVRLRTRSKAGFFTGLIGFIVIVFVFTLAFCTIGLSTIGDIIAYDRDETSVTVVIENEKNGNSPTLEHVIGTLHSAGLIKQKQLCIFFAKFRHFDGYKNSDNVWVPTEYLSGVYYLEPGLGLEGMLNTIKKSTSTGADTITLTFPEGWTISQIFERLEKNGVCDASKLYANIEPVAKQYDFYYEINQSGLRYLGVEGYLFPDTYEFYKNENAVSVLKKLFDNSDAKWKKSYSKRAKELGYTRDEILIIASIIQREAANSAQMRDVSSILHNRLKSSTYPSIQCNSTLDYVNNSVKSHVDASLAAVYTDAYNTYRVEGLPPGPICNPGIDAIEAALNPNDTNYYFFAHNNKGKIYLAENYAQFQKDCVQVAKDNAS